MCRRASAKLSSKWRFRKFSMNFKAKRSSFSRIFSLFTLDGYVKCFGLGMTMVHQLGYQRLDVYWYFVRKHSVLVTRLKLPPTGDGICGPSYETPLWCIPTILVLFWFQRSDCWLGCCVAGRKTGGLISFAICGGCSRTLRYEWAPPQVTQLCSTALTGAGAGTGDVCLSRSRALTISFNSATSGDTPEVEALALTLATMALLRSENFDCSDDA
ncbi:hypothetical protein Tco_0414017 [Tanacetum coccineum]